MKEDEKGKYVNIGKRSVLKRFKKYGLIEEDTLNPDVAVKQVGDQIEDAAVRWYKKGARRGAIQFLRALVDGDIEVKKKKNGDMEIIGYEDKLSWQTGFLVTAGAKKITVMRRTYTINLVTDLGFE